MKRQTTTIRIGTLACASITMLLGIAARGQEVKTPEAAAELAPAPAVALFPVPKDGKWGYIDKTGKLVIQPQFDFAWDFSEGLACVEVKTKRGYIDPTGKVVIEPAYHLAYGFHEGLAAVMIPKGTFGGEGGVVNAGKWGYIDKTGKMAIPPRDPGLWAGDFHEGIARYKTHGSGMGTHIYIQKNGGEWQSFTHFGRDFHEGLAAVPANNKYGYKNIDKKYVVEPQFPEAGDFSEGLAPVAKEIETTVEAGGKQTKKKERKWGFIDKEGKFVIEAQYDGALSFGEGLAPVAQLTEVETQAGGKTVKKNERRWGYVDKTGKTVIEPKYEYAAPFAAGLGRVASGGKFGFVDKTGKIVVEPEFDAAWEFSQGLGHVIVDGKEGYIDPAGKFIWPPSK